MDSQTVVWAVKHLCGKSDSCMDGHTVEWVVLTPCIPLGDKETVVWIVR